MSDDDRPGQSYKQLSMVPKDIAADKSKHPAVQPDLNFPMKNLKVLQII